MGSQMSRKVWLESRGEIAVGAYVCFLGSVNELMPSKIAFARATEIAFVAFVGLFTSVSAQMFVEAILALSNVWAMRTRELALGTDVGFGHLPLDEWVGRTYVVFE